MRNLLLFFATTTLLLSCILVTIAVTSLQQNSFVSAQEEEAPSPPTEKVIDDNNKNNINVTSSAPPAPSGVTAPPSPPPDVTPSSPSPPPSPPTRGGSDETIDISCKASDTDNFYWCVKLPASSRTAPVFSPSSEYVSFATKDEKITSIKLIKPDENSKLNPSTTYDASQSENNKFSSPPSPFGSFCYGKGEKYNSLLIISTASGVTVTKVGDETQELRINLLNNSKSNFVAATSTHFFTIEVSTGKLLAVGLDEVVSLMSTGTPVSIETIKNKAKIDLKTYTEGKTVDFANAAIATFPTVMKNTNQNQRYYIVVTFGTFMMSFAVVADADASSSTTNLYIPSNWTHPERGFLLTNSVTSMTVPFALPDDQMVYAGFDTTLYSRSVKTKESIWSYFHDNRMTYRANPRGAFFMDDEEATEETKRMFVVTTCHSDIIAFNLLSGVKNGATSRTKWIKTNTDFANMDVDEKTAGVRFSTKIAPVILNGKVFVAREDGKIAVLSALTGEAVFVSTDEDKKPVTIETGATKDVPLTSIAVSPSTNQLIIVLADQLVKSIKIEKQQQQQPTPAVESTSTSTSTTTSTTTTTTEEPQLTPAPPSAPTKNSDNSDANSGSDETTRATRKLRTKISTTTTTSTATPTTTTTTTAPSSTPSPWSNKDYDNTKTSSSTSGITKLFLLLLFGIIGFYLYKEREYIPDWIAKAKKFVEEQIEKQMEANNNNNNNNGNGSGGVAATDDGDDDDEMNQVHEGAVDDEVVSKQQQQQPAVVNIPSNTTGNNRIDVEEDEDDNKPLIKNNSNNNKQQQQPVPRPIAPPTKLSAKNDKEDNNSKKPSTIGLAPTKKGFTTTSTKPSLNTTSASSSSSVISAEIVEPRKTVIPRGPAAKMAAPLPKRGALGGGKPVSVDDEDPFAIPSTAKTSSKSAPSMTTTSSNNNTAATSKPATTSNNNNNAGWSWDADEEDW